MVDKPSATDPVEEPLVVEVPEVEPTEPPPPEPPKPEPAPEPPPPPEEKPLPEEPDQEEIDSYSARVQARIKKMSAQTYAERRKAEALNRQLDESARVARAIIDENQRLRSTLHQGESFLKTTNKDRLEARIAAANTAYKTAFDAGDAAALATAATELGRLGAQLDRNEAWQPSPPEPPPPPPPPQRPPPQVDQKTLDWQDKNQWFGRDDAMTGFALGVHRHLVNVENVDPRGDDYFRRIDGEMKKRFPENFGSPTAVPQRSPVAPATRGPRGPRKVELSSTQVALAKRLGLTNQQYAEEVLKLNV